MPNAPHIEELAERVERLLVRYDELQRTNALLADQVEGLTQERDSLKSRLGAARARVEALLERLPQTNGNEHANGNGRGSGNATSKTTGSL